MIMFVASTRPTSALADRSYVANSIVRPGACGWANAIVRAVRGLACQDGRHAQALSAHVGVGIAWRGVNVAEVEREADGSTLRCSCLSSRKRERGDLQRTTPDRRGYVA